VDGLLENELDLGIGSFPAAPEEIQSIPLFTEKLALAVPKNHQFPVHPEPSLMSLAKLPSILLPDHYHLRQQVNQACKKLGFSPRPMFEMTSMTTIINMVSEGIAITVLPLPYLKFVSHPKIDILPLDSPSLTRHIVVAYHRDRYRGAAANAFIEQLTRFPFQINSIHR
jgi:DNA-binding transcriptional LysR family regulator